MNLQVLLSALAVLAGGTAAADELISPTSLERNQPADFAYRFDKGLTGRGSLDIEWTDVVGRLVERRRIPVDLINEGTSSLSIWRHTLPMLWEVVQIRLRALRGAYDCDIEVAPTSRIATDEQRKAAA